MGISEKKKKNQFRKLENIQKIDRPIVQIGDKKLINFCSNDYLGMAMNPRVLSRVERELVKSGFGAGSAALLGGRSQVHQDLENRISKFAGFESALLFSSGYLANIGTLRCLLTRKDRVFHDKLNHASLIDGVLSIGCKHKRYPHLGCPDLYPLATGEKSAIVTESIFSMDGDAADIPKLWAIANKENSLLYVDDAHGFGVVNNHRGATVNFDNESANDNLIVMITLGKALGSFGGMILSSFRMREYLINHNRTFIYDTAIPAVAAAAAIEALDLMIADSTPYVTLHKNIRYFKALAKEANITLKETNSPIQPVLYYSENVAIEKEKWLRKNGFYVKAIRPPTVPPGTARLRVVVTALHSFNQLEHLIELLAVRH